MVGLCCLIFESMLDNVSEVREATSKILVIRDSLEQSQDEQYDDEGEPNRFKIGAGDSF